MDEALAFREMISRILTLQPGDDAIVAVKIDICRKYGLDAVPKNSAILAAASTGGSGDPPEDPAGETHADSLRGGSGCGYDLTGTLPARQMPSLPRRA